MVQAGRARWKIENETFNTLKNQGYHIEHNFGHGKKNLSMNFFVLNLLAFFIHQILDLIVKRERSGRCDLRLKCLRLDHQAEELRIQPRFAVLNRATDPQLIAR